MRYAKKLMTKDFVTGKKRPWDAYKSKLAAAMQLGLRIDNIFQAGTKVLYLGASTGTTPSHISDIVGPEGFIYAVEFSDRVYISLERLAKERNNIMPLLADARRPDEYRFVEKVDVVYVDISQPDEIEIAIRNANMFLKPQGYLLIAVKSQSIDVTKSPSKVYEESKIALESAGFKVDSLQDIDQFERHHAFIVARK